MSRGWQHQRRVRRSRAPGTLFVRHALAVAELHTRLVEGSRQQRFELLELRAEPACWRSYDGFGAQPLALKPDSYVRLGLGDFEDSYFIEVDRGTEGSRAIEGQLERYLAYERSGIEQTERSVFPRVLWLTPDERRAGVIAGCVERLPKRGRELFRWAAFDRFLDVMVPASRHTIEQERA